MIGMAFDGSPDTRSLNPVHSLAKPLAVATGVIHVYAGVVEGRIPVSIAGIGFLGGVVLFLSDYRRSLLYVAGIIYTAIQIPSGLW